MSRQRIECIEGDITVVECDAIVNAAKCSLRGGGGVDGAIHRAAGPGLLEECVRRYPDGCATGEARITAAYGLRARYVIHTPGPIFGEHGGEEAALLGSCYREALRVGREHGCASFAFPAISCGVYGYPHRDAARVALQACAEAMKNDDGIERVLFVLFGAPMHEIFREELVRLSD